MELYVHLPFCARKCRYCDFPSWPGMERLMPRYVDALLAEAASRGPAAVETVFFGGGTPSLLSAALLDRLIAGLRSVFDFARDVEFTVEANPGTLTPAWLDAAVRGGVNRLSMGVQALQPELLRTLGRIHTFEQARLSVEAARLAGIRSLNLDLMFGLPGQTPVMWRKTLDAALALSPEHLSCYGLIPEEGTPLKADLDAGRLALPDEDDDRRMYDDALTTLAAHGFEHYEISNFALPGYACRHNLGYWRQTPYLGLGASAASCLPTAEQSAAYVRESNPRELEAYLSMVEERRWPLRQRELISREDARFETMMLGLRTMEGVSEADFQRMHGISLDACYGEALRDLEVRGLIERRDGFCRLTRRGMDVQNAVLVELMA